MLGGWRRGATPPAEATDFHQAQPREGAPVDGGDFSVFWGQAG